MPAKLITSRVSSESHYPIPNRLNSLLIAYRFYYVDERQADGSPTIPVGGPAAGKTYVELAEKKEQGPWAYTFVDGKGYVEFK